MLWFVGDSWLGGGGRRRGNSSFHWVVDSSILGGEGVRCVGCRKPSVRGTRAVKRKGSPMAADGGLLNSPGLQISSNLRKSSKPSLDEAMTKSPDQMGSVVI